MPIRYLPKLNNKAVNNAPTIAGFHLSLTSGSTLKIMVKTAVTAISVIALFKMLMRRVVVLSTTGKYSLILLLEIR
ncbi:hypothetical protein D3C86_2044720 [compost metagenome]